MKQLTCEMCGSTDLVKDGGVFICQDCGCKYSVEEARKMMSETEDEKADEYEDYIKAADASGEQDFLGDIEIESQKGIQIDSIVCPQCGSSDVVMLTETQGTCNVCGAHFVAQPPAEEKNIYNYYNIISTNEPETEHKETKGVMPVQYSRDDFMRKVLIDFVQDDSPLDVFDSDFSGVSQLEHEVLVSKISAEMTYQVNIGNDRSEPYIETERYYNKDKKEYDTRTVTKYKTVTDWHPLSGTHRSNSLAITENGPGPDLDEPLFRRSYDRTLEKTIEPAPPEFAENMHITESAKKKVYTDHARNIRSDLKLSLPGDKQKDLDYNITRIISVDESLYVAQEYEVSIDYKGKQYKKRAFPFGGMEIGGDDIVGGQKESDHLVWKQTSGISWITMALLVVSIAVSLLVHYHAAVIAAFAIAAACFIYHEITTHKKEKAIKNDYRNQNIEALNKKLKEMGFAPVEADEI